MKKSDIFRLLSLAGLLIVTSLLGGCVGGTTYGTGVTQEKQTLDDLVNIATLRKKRKVIDYSSRPDIVIPNSKVLVEPIDAGETTTEADWPESPEDRLARIRREADEANSTTAGQANFSRSKKKYGRIQENAALNEAPIGKGVPNVSCDPDGKIMRRCTPTEISRAVRAERGKIKSVGKSVQVTGYQRRYLTEPPAEYRTPSNTAPVGDEGYSAAELKKIKELEKEKADRHTTNPF